MKVRALHGMILAMLLLAAGARGQTAAPSKAPQEVQWKSAKSLAAPVIAQTSAQVNPPMPELIAAPQINQSLPEKTDLVDGLKPLPINLATAMQLASAQPLDIRIAARQVGIAAAQYDRAKFQWVPSLVGGADYFRHDGGAQNVNGSLLSNSRSGFMTGGGVNAVVGLNDAIFAPLAARQDLNARRANLQAVSNDTALAVAEAYFNVQQARGELAGAIAFVKEAADLVRRTTNLSEGLSSEREALRAKVELSHRQQTVSALRERWKIASADLMRLLRLDPSAIIEPVEPANLKVELIDSCYSIDDLIAIGLTSRPELGAHQSLVKATLRRLQQERLRPLVPSIAIRGASTGTVGTLGFGTFGAGTGGRIGDFQGRFDYDVQVLWELQNFGLGNKARIDERKAEREVAVLELFKIQDRIAAEIVQAQAQVKSASERVAFAEPALKDAADSMKKNMEGLTTRREGNLLVLVVRPQEVVASLQALAQANADYHAAIADFNRAQFRLYRALGHPSQCLPSLPLSSR